MDGDEVAGDAEAAVGLGMPSLYITWKMSSANPGDLPEGSFSSSLYLSELGGEIGGGGGVLGCSRSRSWAYPTRRRWRSSADRPGIDRRRSPAGTPLARLYRRGRAAHPPAQPAHGAVLPCPPPSATVCRPFPPVQRWPACPAWPDLFAGILQAGYLNGWSAGRRAHLRRCARRSSPARPSPIATTCLTLRLLLVSQTPSSPADRWTIRPVSRGLASVIASA